MLRRPHAVASPRAALGFLLALPISGHNAALAPISESASVGRFRSRHIFHHLTAVLVSGARARSRDSPRPGKKALAEKTVRNFRARLAQFRGALAASPDRVFAAGRSGHTACAFGAQ